MAAAIFVWSRDSEELAMAAEGTGEDRKLADLSMQFKNINIRRKNAIFEDNTTKMCLFWFRRYSRAFGPAGPILGRSQILFIV